PFEGRANVHWLTGTASTVMVGCVEGILGVRPLSDGILISPAIPSDWKGFKMTKMFRGKKLEIEVVNPDGKESGVKEVWLGDEKRGGEVVPFADLKEENKIKVVMG
ncbi:MAG: N,N'-diacetylchitobiose phosphorylase, partial [Ruminococcaceae bacterium]|nr:N,N'-diacetylchitobiose phosphorylase [Oscillospiraceae bacterium]